MSQIEHPVEQSGIANLVQMTASCSKLCVLAKMGFILAKPAQNSGFRQNGFNLGKAAQD